MSSPSKNRLTYFLSEKQDILIITFIGAISRSNLSVMEECLREVAQSRARWVIINYRDASEKVEHSVLQMMARLHQSIRGKAAILRASGLHPSFRPILVEAQVLESEELCDNVAQALQQYSVPYYRQAA